MDEVRPAPGRTAARLLGSGASPPDPPDERARPLPSGLAAGLVFLASGAVLVLETVSLRLVGPYLGVTLQVTSSVIGIALAAIAYGAWFGGWVADRRDPRHLIAPALILAGVTTAATLPIVRYAGEVLRGDAVSAILLLTALAVFLPAALLSAVTPLVVKLQLGDLRQTGQVVGRLSSIGTLGGITATLATGFILVAALPSSVIVLGLGVVLTLAGVAFASYVGRRDRTLPVGGGPRARAVVAAVALVGGGLSSIVPTPCDVETAYHCAAVEVDPTDPDGRLLILNSARHSYVDLADPTHLEFAYMRWIGTVADLLGPPRAPLDTLHLGGGGFTMPRYLAATRPGGTNLVYEIDGDLVDLGKRELGVRPGPELQPVVGDARLLVRDLPADSADFVVGDAFGHLVVPWHLATREMVAEIRRVTRPGGVYVQNVIDYPPLRFIRAETATVRAEFAHVVLVAPPAALAGEQGDNFLIVASDAPLPVDRLRSALAAPAEEPVEVVSGRALDDLVGKAHVLTDDFAPVDQLLATL